jgi:adenine-specific DNA-methyltransferase
VLELNKNIPSLIKYMGSKTEIINYVISGLNEIHKVNQPVCDLFAGSATLAGALRNNDIEYISNDIQLYSSVLAKTYLLHYDWELYPSIDELIIEAETLEAEWKGLFSEFWSKTDYERTFSLDTFTEIEEYQRAVINSTDFQNTIKQSSGAIKGYHLFTKLYSGTYWSFRQCVWIDILRAIADKYKNIEPLYNLVLSSTMYAMAYNSQSTGHYAQFRKAEKESSMNDILLYRRKNIKDFFKRKYEELRGTLANRHTNVKTYSLDYIDCLDKLDKGTLVYADPPYCFVHYSRFYHALETFIKYDYPEIKYEGRYRNDRHQSPFCIRTQVREAFQKLFSKVSKNDCELVLSYSNSATSMIGLDSLLFDSYTIFNEVSSLNENECEERIKLYLEEKNKNESKNDQTIEVNINLNSILTPEEGVIPKYEVLLKMFEHIHSTMGRREDKDRDVLETLIIIRKTFS